MRPLHSLALALSVSTAAVAPARADIRVSALVETEEAAFFQSPDAPDVVWYFPRSEVRLFPVDPPIPNQNYWRAAVVLKEVTVTELAFLRPEWAGLTLAPYILRPDTECALQRVPQMRFVQQEYRAQGRDVSAANVAPVCQFSFRLPLVVSAELRALLESRAASGTLITRDLRLDLRVQDTVPWTDVFAPVAAAVGGDLTRALEAADARSAVQAALDSPALYPIQQAMTAVETQAFLDAVYAALFTPTDLTGAVVHLVPSAPPGALVYHETVVVRSL